MKRILPWKFRPLVTDWAVIWGLTAVITLVSWAVFYRDAEGLLIFAASAALAAAAWFRRRRSAQWRARRELIAAVNARAGARFWLNRDEHLAFGVASHRLGHLLPYRQVVRADEDAGLELAALEGRGDLAVTFERFYAVPLMVPALWELAGAVVPADAGDVRPLPGERGFFWRLLHQRIGRSGSGLGPRVVSGAEVAELIRQLAAADPMPEPGEES